MLSNKNHEFINPGCNIRKNTALTCEQVLAYGNVVTDGSIIQDPEFTRIQDPVLARIKDPVFGCSYWCGVTPGCANWMVDNNNVCKLMTNKCHRKLIKGVTSGNKQCSLGREYK